MKFRNGLLIGCAFLAGIAAAPQIARYSASGWDHIAPMAHAADAVAKDDNSP